MGCITINMDEVGSIRFLQFQDLHQVSPAEALGILTMFWHATRTNEVESGSYQDLKQYFPFGGHEYENVIGAMNASGYLRDEGDQQFTIIDNQGLQAKLEKRRADGKAAGHAGQAKRGAKPKAPKSKALAKVVDTAAQQANAAAWEAYSRAYTQRLGHPPTRNAKANAMIAQLVQRLGAEDAPHVLMFYVNHPSTFYQEKHYMLNLAVNDAESLHAQWKRNRPVTRQDAQQFAKVQGVQSQRERILAGLA